MSFWWILRTCLLNLPDRQIGNFLKFILELLQIALNSHIGHLLKVHSNFFDFWLDKSIGEFWTYFISCSCLNCLLQVKVQYSSPIKLLYNLSNVYIQIFPMNPSGVFKKIFQNLTQVTLWAHRAISNFIHCNLLMEASGSFYLHIFWILSMHFS